MKQKKSKMTRTNTVGFHLQTPLKLAGIFDYLNVIIKSFNEREQRRWKNVSFFRRLFHHPTQYKVEVRAENPKVKNDYQGLHHYRIWIEDTRSRRIHFDVLYVQDSITSDIYFLDGVKYHKLALRNRDSSKLWFLKKDTRMYEILEYIIYYYIPA